ncbi:hypothetical protein [Primorskyibacter sp. 2E233]|uniref:hypothetical protein n=1 Tax=Primorskyibacter sp. 2E233 TaxID=3413431 RepID=UPI003BEF65C8
MTSQLASAMDLEQSDIYLHACLDLLLMKAAMDHPSYQKLAMALMTSPEVLETAHSPSDWAYHITGRTGLAFDARFIAAVVIARLTQQPQILHKFLDIELEPLDKTHDLALLRRMHATMTGALLRPLLKTAMGAPKEQMRLVAESDRVLQMMQDWTAANMVQDAAPTEHKEGTSILLLLSWIPAEPNTGAHLKQIVSYTHGLMMAGQEQGRSPVRVKLLLTYDNSTTWLVRNYQAYSRGSAAIIESAVKEALDPEMADNFSVEHILPQHHDRVEDWLQTIVSSAEDFAPDAVIRWFGFYASNAVAPALHHRFPTLGIQFNANNPVDRYADVLLNQGQLDPKKASDTRWRNHRIPLEVLPRRLDLPRSAFDLPEGVFTMVSTLSGGRLEKAVTQLSAERLGALMDMLDARPDLLWLWVGVHDVETLRAHDPRLRARIDAGQIRCLQFAEDLRALYQHCDLYVHLPAMAGGGMGVAMAIEEDMAVLCHAGTDPCNFLPDTTIPTAWEPFFKELETLIASPQARRAYADQQRDWLRDKHGLTGVGHEVLDYIDEAIALHGASESAKVLQKT